jgi:PilZ domain-containing protein
MPMFEDRRAFPRRVVDCPGSIVPDAGSDALDCVVADVSDGGARLVVAGGVPEEFGLIINDGTGAKHSCRVVWRLDDEIGVEFV